MRPTKLTKFLKPVLITATEAIKNHSAGATLTVSGIGYLMAVVSGCKATVKAVRKTDYEEEKKGEPLTKKELVETNWKYYIPTAALTVGSTLGLVAASRNYGGQIKSLAALYAISETALKDQEEAVKQTFGEKQAAKVQDETARQVLARTFDESPAVMNTRKGSTLCLDRFSGRYFRMDIENLRKAINDANFKLNREGYLSYNELFYEICDEFEDMVYGDTVGWKAEYGLIDPKFTSALTKDNEPCLVLDFYTRPYTGFDH